MRRLVVPPLLYIPLTDSRRFYAQAKDILRVEWMHSFPKKRRRITFPKNTACVHVSQK